MRHRVLTAVLTLVFCVGCCLPALAAEKQYENLTDLGLTSKSALLMEEDTGTILYEQNSHEALPPASVTKVMTLLLIYEGERDGKFDWTDTVQVSEHAASMGGSQVFLEEGETQTAADLTKSIAIASANDAAVAMAEFLAGSEEAFVQKMNERAKELCQCLWFGYRRACFQCLRHCPYEPGVDGEFPGDQRVYHHMAGQHRT